MALQDFPRRHFKILSLMYLFSSALIYLLLINDKKNEGFFSSKRQFLRVTGVRPAVYCLSEMIVMDFSIFLLYRSKAEREGILLCWRESFL